jgi:hypothetical protein
MAASIASPDPDLDEMLRILDAASAMRRERELVEEQLSAEEFKRRLRERLLAAAAATGDPVKPEEVDAAIELYFERLHAYEDPPLGPSVALAHLYVRRWSILKWGGLAAASAALLWWVFLRPSSPLGIVGANERAVAAAASSVERRLAAARSIVADESAAARLEAIAKEAVGLQSRGEAGTLRKIEEELAQLGETLGSEYTVEVVHAPGEKSAVDRYYEDAEGRRVSGYYLIVEARDAAGKPVALPIRNSEADNETRTVSKWAERVPEEVYQRLRADKQTDGRLDEYVYAVKRRGKVELEVRLPGSDGQPLARLGQITEW